MARSPLDPQKQALLNAILPHVSFDGWRQSAFEAAVIEVGISKAQAHVMCPRGAVDLAKMYHVQGDEAMVTALKSHDLQNMRFRDKVALAIKLRLAAVEDKDIVRRGTALFTLPHLAPLGAELIWGTANTIWVSLGDRADDINWYTKRTTLAGVYAATVLFWLGDQSEGDCDTHAFIDRRIAEVMQFEALKLQIRENKALRPALAPIETIMQMIKPPARIPPVDLPGFWNDPQS
jgi:ubiquinone biosynthesis protein COQ9